MSELGARAGEMSLGGGPDGPASTGRVAAGGPSSDERPATRFGPADQNSGLPLAVPARYHAGLEAGRGHGVEPAEHVAVGHQIRVGA
jgi:hypothetical protein